MKESKLPWNEFKFHDNADRERLMEGLEEIRRVSVYLHICTNDCTLRGKLTLNK